MITVTGNTDPVRAQLKELHGQWDAENRRWILPDESKPAVEAIRVPIGGGEQLWEPCSRCGDEPVDGSGLCARCRGTRSLVVRELRSVDDEARDMLHRIDIGTVTMGFYEHASRGPEVAIPANCRELGTGSPLDGGYHVELLTDGERLYTLHIHHYEGDRERCYLVDPTRMMPVYARIVGLLIAGHTVEAV